MDKNIITLKDIKKSNKQAERTLYFAVFSCLPESIDKIKVMVSKKFKLLAIEKNKSYYYSDDIVHGLVYIPPYKTKKYEKEKLTKILRDFVRWQESILKENKND